MKKGITAYLMQFPIGGPELNARVILASQNHSTPLGVGRMHRHHFVVDDRTLRRTLG